jgi:hypothetical protein
VTRASTVGMERGGGLVAPGGAGVIGGIGVVLAGRARTSAREVSPPSSRRNRSGTGRISR